MTDSSPMDEWMMHDNKLVHVLEDYEIDLTPITTEAAITVAIEKLRQQGFATPQMIEQAGDKLTAYVMWLTAEERAKQMRDKRQSDDEP